MNVSAQVRYLDYAVRPLHAKNRRRSGEDALARRKVEPRPEDERPDDAEPSTPDLILQEDDEDIGYSRSLPPRATTTPRNTMIAESVRHAPIQNTALLTLINSGEARPRGPEAAAPIPAPSRGDAFYDLLDQVIAQA